MALIFEQVDGFYRPRILCDSCDQPITDPNECVVLYATPNRDPEAPNAVDVVKYAHAFRCQERLFAQVGHTPLTGFSDTLGEHLVRLCVHSGLTTAEQFKDTYDSLVADGKITVVVSEDENAE